MTMMDFLAVQVFGMMVTLLCLSIMLRIRHGMGYRDSVLVPELVPLLAAPGPGLQFSHDNATPHNTILTRNSLQNADIDVMEIVVAIEITDRHLDNLDSFVMPPRMGSIAYTVDVVRFHWKKDEPIIFSPSIHLSRFTFNHTPEATRCQLNFTGIGEFTCLQTSIQLHREFGYYLLQIYLPSMMIVFVSWFSFYLPIDAVPARVSVGLITVLTLTTESSKARATLPHDPDVNKKTTSSIFARFNDKRIDVVCRFVFPVAYLTMQIAYWLYYIQH
ncbi:glycine receptor subunit alpha-2-like [Liolophura sinensis]|uniref:glycine receptor subunit alpha-2-like n=1 Tax=Liolophura sinensis TaxID=3198878 RepID=UPI0031589127